MALAYWIIGDGSRQGQGLHLSVYAFSLEQAYTLIAALHHNFGVKCSVHHHDWPRIYIDKASMPCLREFVKPYIAPTMLYKLGL
jgi:hypothetical protein